MFFIGVKYFWSSMQRGRLKNVLRLTILSLSINIGVFIAGLALVRGFQSETLSKTLHMYGHAEISPYRNTKSLDLKFQKDEYYLLQTFPLLKEWLEKLDKWIKVSPKDPIKLEKVIEKYEIHGGVSKKKSTDGILVNGLNQVDAEYLLSKYLTAGSTNFESPTKKEGSVIGHRMAKRLGVGVGDTFDLLLKTKSELDSIPMQVVGIFDFGFHEFDSSLIFVQSSLLNEYQARSVGVVYINNPEEIDEYVSAVKRLDPNIQIHSWRQRNRLIQDMFNSQIRAMSLIMGLFILSAIIQSITSLFVLLSERSYDLSVLTMLGMSGFQRYAMFAAYGLLVTFSNTFFGILSGIGLVLIYPQFKFLFESWTGHKIIHSEAFWLSDFNPQLVLSDILSVAVATLVIMSIAMLIASHFTSRIDVIKGVKD